jgi:hypothetical protein
VQIAQSGGVDFVHLAEIKKNIPKFFKRLEKKREFMLLYYSK